MVQYTSVHFLTAYPVMLFWGCESSHRENVYTMEKDKKAWHGTSLMLIRIDRENEVNEYSGVLFSHKELNYVLLRKWLEIQIIIISKMS